MAARPRISGFRKGILWPQMFCAACGMSLPEEARFCMRCGSPTNSTEVGPHTRTEYTDVYLDWGTQHIEVPFWGKGHDPDGHDAIYGRRAKQELEAYFGDG